jgi:hypothetical protein
MDKSKFENKQEWQKFGLNLGTIFAILGISQLIFTKKPHLYLFIAALIILFSALIIPIVLKPFYILFSYLGFTLNWFSTKIILFAFFYLIIAPIGILLKIFGHDLLNLEEDKNMKSYWIKRKTTKFKKDDYERQY